MAFDEYLEMEASGSRTITDPKLRAFQLQHPDRCHYNPGDDAENGWPAIILPDQPFKLHRIPGRDMYRLRPIALTELSWWPPAFGGAYSGADRFPMPGDGVLVGARVHRDNRAGYPPYLTIDGTFEGRAVSFSGGGYPVALLQCAAATLTRLVNRPVREIGNEELVEA